MTATTPTTTGDVVARDRQGDPGVPWRLADPGSRLIVDRNGEPVAVVAINMDGPAAASRVARVLVESANSSRAQLADDLADARAHVERLQRRQGMSVTDRMALLGESVDVAVEPEKTLKQNAATVLANEFTDPAGLRWWAAAGDRYGVPAEIMFAIARDAQAVLARTGHIGLVPGAVAGAA